MCWETVDPERFVPDGYVVIRVDSRGTGRSPGYLDPRSERETRDYYEAIEWAAAQPWCDGRVGLCGVSYYAMNQWQVASLQPPHLEACVIWDGASDHYRERTYHGGILSNTFTARWWSGRILRNQHGLGSRGLTDPWLGEPASGPETLGEEELAANRIDLPQAIKQHPLCDEFHRERTGELERITVPLLSATSWSGLSIHPRGNFEGYLRAGSPKKWLEVHGGRHEEFFYETEGHELQRRFLERFLKGVDNGFDDEAPVILHVRHPGERFLRRDEQEWPLARTRWTPLHLDAGAMSVGLAAGEAARCAFHGFGEGVTFFGEPLESELEITGPVAAKLFVSSSTSDADLFVTLRAFDPDGTEVAFQGAQDPLTPIAQGCLRASHRRLDPDRSLPYRPYHPHDRVEPLEPGEVYELDVEIWPTCVVLPAGYRLAVTVAGRDFARGVGEVSDPAELADKGSGPYLHCDPDHRPAAVYDGTTELYTGAGRPSRLLLPVIPR